MVTPSRVKFLAVPFRAPKKPVAPYSTAASTVRWEMVLPLPSKVPWNLFELSALRPMGVHVSLLRSMSLIRVTVIPE